MSKLSKKAILSVLSLVLTFVALGATTFAWFTLGNTASVGQFEAEIRGSEGLEIRFGKVTSDSIEWENNWYSNINSDTMQGYINSIFSKESARLEAVTTKNGKEEFKKFNGLDVKEFYTDAIDNEDYIEFKLQFRTKNDNVKLKLNKLNLSSEAITDWVPDIEFTNELGNKVTPNGSENQPWTIYPHHALRVSLEQKTDNVIILESEENDGNIGFDKERGAFDYFSNKLDLTEDERKTLADKANPGKTTKVVDSTTFEFSNTDTNEEYKTLDLTIRVWIEGWDGNAYDAIFDGKIQVGFDFELESTIEG